MVGHAVRAFYMYTAMADLAAELDDKALKKACEILWRDAMETKMYVTAGFGPSASNEGFTSDYDLPNDTAYAETCATVAMIFFAQRMLNLDLDRQYADIMELGLYNGGLSGLSHDGTNYFYENKLESSGKDSRWAWHVCPCCTMNVARLISSIGGYYYSTGKDLIAIHLYGGASTVLALGGNKISISETSNYPWDGKIRIKVTPATPASFTIKLRIPAWAEKKAKAAVNGKAMQVSRNLQKGYLTVKREWHKGDVITLDLPMDVRRIYANPMVKADQGKVALARGPLVYCIEQKDNGKTPVATLMLPRKAKVANAKMSLFGGITVLKAKGKAYVAQRLGRFALFQLTTCHTARRHHGGALLCMEQPRAQLPCACGSMRSAETSASEAYPVAAFQRQNLASFSGGSDFEAEFFDDVTDFCDLLCV